MPLPTGTISPCRYELSAWPAGFIHIHIPAKTRTLLKPFLDSAAPRATISSNGERQMIQFIPALPKAWGGGGLFGGGSRPRLDWKSLDIKLPKLDTRWVASLEVGYVHAAVLETLFRTLDDLPDSDELADPQFGWLIGGVRLAYKTPGVSTISAEFSPRMGEWLRTHRNERLGNASRQLVDAVGYISSMSKTRRNEGCNIEVDEDGSLFIYVPVLAKDCFLSVKQNPDAPEMALVSTCHGVTSPSRQFSLLCGLGIVHDLARNEGY